MTPSLPWSRVHRFLALVSHFRCAHVRWGGVRIAQFGTHLGTRPCETYDARSWLFGDAQELKVGGADEHAIVRDERQAEPDRRAAIHRSPSWTLSASA